MRAAWMAGEALSQMDEHISFFKLIPGPHGKFDVRVDGELIGGHRHEPGRHIFPDKEDLMKAINQRIQKKAPA